MSSQENLNLQQHEPSFNGEPNRRKVLKKGLLSTGFLFAGSRPAFAVPSGNELPVPATWDGEPLVVDETNRQIWPGYTTACLTVNGSFPAPIIRLNQGDLFSAQINNRLNSQAVVLHWHGLLAPSAYDGHPRQVVSPGQSYQVSFPVHQEPSTCWYHSHSHGLTGEHVYKGLAGFFIIDNPERDAALGLPTGTRDVPLMIRDWKSNTTRSLSYAPSNFEHMWGYLGDTVLVNGTPDAWMSVDQGLWRFRLLNGSNARVYRLAFSDNRPMTIIGSDGGLTGEKTSVTSFDLGPGQRAEILVSFANLGYRQSTFLKSLAFTEGRPGGGGGGMGGGGGGPAGPRQGDALDIMEFYVGTTGGDQTTPQELPAPPLPKPELSRRTRSFAMNVTNGNHTINGLTYSLSRNDFTAPAGEVEIWQFQNQNGMHHPMHCHGAFFHVLTRNGSSNIKPVDHGLRDTVLVYPNETVRVAIAFGNRGGEYLMHCHNLEHEHNMMSNFTVSATETPKLEIKKINGEVVVSWPSNLGGWQLERSTDLENWAPIDGQLTIVGSQLQYREATSEKEAHFRLRIV